MARNRVIPSEDMKSKMSVLNFSIKISFFRLELARECPEKRLHNCKPQKALPHDENKTLHRAKGEGHKSEDSCWNLGGASISNHFLDKTPA